VNSNADEHSIPTSPEQAAKGAAASFFESWMGRLLLVVLAAGLLAVSLTWRTSDIEFLDGGQIRVAQSMWWGRQKTVATVEYSAQDGWVEIDEEQARGPLGSRAVRVRN